jgi:hypothetical protein
VALSPFALAVNVGSYFTQLTNKSDRTDNDGSSSKNIHYPSSCIKDDGSVRRSCRDDSDYNSPPYIAAEAKCVVERSGTEQYSDAAPGAGAGLPTWNDKADSMSKSCSPTVQIKPLSKSRDALKAAIDAFGTCGTTAGQLGTPLCLVYALAQLGQHLAGRLHARRLRHRQTAQDRGAGDGRRLDYAAGPFLWRQQQPGRNRAEPGR